MLLGIYWKVISWSVFMLIVFFIPSGNLPETQNLPFFDKIIHIVLFLVFTILLLFARREHTGSKMMRPGALLLVFATVLVFGTTIELGQFILNLGRTWEFLDLVSDLIGYFTGLFLFFMYSLFQN